MYNVDIHQLLLEENAFYAKLIAKYYLTYQNIFKNLQKKLSRKKIAPRSVKNHSRYGKHFNILSKVKYH